jgi:hypothetical protein
MGQPFSSFILRAGFAIALLVLPLQSARAGGAIAIGPCATFGYAFD